MNEEQLRSLIHTYKIKLKDNQLGQLSYLHDEIFREVSLRSILLCSDFVIKEDITDFSTGDRLFVKGFVHSWIFSSVFDKDVIDEGNAPPQLEYFLHIDERSKTIYIEPKC